jgi:hypothetical protein
MFNFSYGKPWDTSTLRLSARPIADPFDATG